MWIYNRGVLNKHEVKNIYIYKKGKIKYSNQQRKKEKKKHFKRVFVSVVQSIKNGIKNQFSKNYQRIWNIRTSAIS